MTKPIIKIVNAETGEEIEREMNAAELKQYKIDQESTAAAKAKQAAEVQDKEAAKASAIAKLEALGLNLAEAQAIFG